MSSTEKLDIRRYLKPAAAQGGGDSEKQSQSLDAAKSKATMGRSGDSNMTLDDKHPVNNLTSGDGFRKWLSHPQERSGHMEAVFQLEQPCVISYIDIGSIWCASLEVQVGLSSWPVGQPYETLAHTVTLMSPTDCTQGKNTTSTKMFSSELFCPGVADQEWDRMKVICRQPYKKLNQFGLSFIRVKTSVQTKSVTEATPKQDSETPTLKSIQNHFFSRPTNGYK